MRNTKRKMLISLAAAAAMAGLVQVTHAANTSYTWIGTGTTTTPANGTWNTTASWYGGTIPASGTNAQLDFGGAGGTAYTVTDNSSAAAFVLNEIALSSSASVAETIAPSASNYTLTFQNNSAAAAPQILDSGSGAFVINPNILLSNSLAVNGTGSGTITLGGVITGTSTGITLNDANNTVVLSNSNTFSGTTLVGAGALQLTALAALTDSALNLGGGTLQLRFETSKTFVTASTTISASSTINVDHLTSTNSKTLSLNAVSIGADTLNVTGADSFVLSFGATTLSSTSGGTTILNPTSAPLQIGATSSNATGSGTTDTLDLDGTSTAGNSVTGKISDGSLGGVLALNKTNSSTWTLAGPANNFSGLTTVSNGILILNKSGGNDAIPAGGLNITGGTVQLAASEEIDNSAAVTISGAGALNLAGFSETIKSITMNGGTVGPTGLLVINSSGTTTVNSGTISAGLTTGTGDLTLGSGAVISGATTLLGDVVFNGTTSGATFGPGAITINASRNFNVTRGTSPVDLTISGNVSSTATSGTQTISVLGGAGSSPNGNYAFNGNISNGTSGGQIALLINNTGVNTSFAGANTFNGGVTISSGIVLLSSSNSLDNTSGPLGPTSASVLLGKTAGSAKASILTNGAITFANAITIQTGSSAVMTIGGSTDDNSVFSGNINLGSPASAGMNATLVSVTTGTNTVNFSGVIQDPTGLTGNAGSVSIGATGSSGTVELSNANTYSAPTSLNLGTLAFGSSSNASPFTSGPIGTAALAFNNGTAIEAIGTQSIGNKVNLGGASSSGDIAVTISGTGALTLNGAFGLSKSGVNTITDNDTTSSTTIAGNVSGSSATLNKAGAGTLILGQANSYSGSTLVTAGNLREGSSNAVPMNSPLFVASGATFTLAGHNNTLFSISDLLPSGGGGTINFGTGGGNILTISGLATTTFSGSMINASLATPAAVTVAGGNNLTLAGQSTAFITLAVQGSGEVILNNTAGAAMTNLISASMTTGGTLLLTQPNQINSTATISVDSAGVFDTGGNNQTVASLSLGLGTVQTEAGTLTLNGDITYTATSTDATALNGNVDLGGAVHNINASNLLAPDSYTIAANFSDGGLTTTGSSTVNLSGTNTYTAATTVSNGKLNITGSLANTAVSVASGAKFGGTGSVAGAVSISDGGSLDLVDGSISPFSVASLTLGSAGAGVNYNLELNTVAGVTSFDTINVSGALVVNIGGVVVNLMNLGGTPANGTYPIITYNPTGSTTNPNFTFLGGSTSELLAGVNAQLTNVSGVEEIVIGAPSNPTWTDGNSTQSWNDGANWSTATVLSGQGAVANFGATGAGSVTLDGNQTVGILYLDSATPYNISTGVVTTNTLIIDDTTDPAGNHPAINVVNGSHTISAPISLTSNGVAVIFSNSSSLTVSNTITATAPGTIAVSGTGTLNIATTGVLPATDALTISGGAKVALAIGGSIATQTVAGLTVDTTTGSQFDVGNNIVNISYSGPSPIGTIAADIASGYAGGAWTGAGIVSSAVVDTHHGVGYLDNGSNNVEVRYTLLGDTDLSGSINFNDLLTLAQNYGHSNVGWAQGDSDYNNSINFNDLLSLAQNYGHQLSAGSAEFSPSFTAEWNLAVAETSAVPEPTSLGLLAIGAMGLMARRRREISDTAEPI